MSDQQKQNSKPAQEEQKVNEKRPQTQQKDGAREGEGQKKYYKNKTRDNAPSKEQLLGQEFKKPKRDNDYYVRRPRVEKEDFYKIEITIDTEIPELPKKGQKISKPDDEVHIKEIEKIGDQIDEQYDKLQKFIEDLRVQHRKNHSQGKTNQDPLRDLVKTKNEEKKALYDVFNEVKKKYDAAKSALEEATNQAATYKQKMKSNMSKTELQKELNYLQEQQKHGDISIQEEKVIIKQISEIQKSLPYAEPLEALTVQIKQLKAEKDVLQKQVKAQGDKIQALKGEIQSSYDTLNSIKSEKEKLNVDFQPQIEARKAEVLPLIEKLKQEKKDKKEAHYQKWVDYEAQEQLVKKIEYMKKKKAQLVRKHLEEQETLKEQEKIKLELSLINENPYKEEISLCQLLQEYCQNLLPKKVQQQEAVQQKKDIQETLKSNEWKKEKVTEISFRRDEELNEFAVSSKKQQKNKKPQQQQQQQANQQNADQPREVLLNHQIECLQWFEQLSIPAPLLQKQLEDTIKLLAQKKKYFEELPSDEVTGYLKPSQKEEEEEQQKTKKEKKQKNKHHDVFNAVEEEFPDMK